MKRILIFLISIFVIGCGKVDPPNSVDEAIKYINTANDFGELICNYDTVDGIFDRNFSDKDKICGTINMGLSNRDYDRIETCRAKIDKCNLGYQYLIDYGNKILKINSVYKIAELVSEKSNNKNCYPNYPNYDKDAYCRALQLVLNQWNVKLYSPNYIMILYNWDVLEKNQEKVNKINKLKAEKESVEYSKMINIVNSQAESIIKSVIK